MEDFGKMDFLQSALEIVQLDVLTNESFNANQCKNLLGNLRKGLEAIHKIFGSNKDVLHPILKDLFWIVTKARNLVESCFQIGDNWSQVVLMQMMNKEAFRELLMEFEFFFHMIYDIALENALICDNEGFVKFYKSMKFYPSDMKEVEDDQWLNCERLKYEMQKLPYESDSHKLANYLLQWRDCIEKVECGEMDVILFPKIFPKPEFGDSPILLGKNVFETSWLGFESVTKVINFDGVEEASIPTLLREVYILAQLNHPNIIQLYFCGYVLDRKGKNHLQFGMEKGDKSLCTMLFEDKDLKITFQAAIDIMIQIACGMCYLHDMKVAHRDLKPANVVVTRMSSLEYNEDAKSMIDWYSKDGFVHVKLIDFGISKPEVKDNFLEMPTGEFQYGTRGYIAPEAIKPLSKLDPFKADVFGFGMICCDILTREKLDCKDITKKRKKWLQNDHVNPSKLKLLIEDCLCKDPSKRPSFSDIYVSLMDIKKDFKAQILHPLHFNFSKWKAKWLSSNMKPQHWWLSLSYNVFMNSKRWWTSNFGISHLLPLNDHHDHIEDNNILQLQPIMETKSAMIIKKPGLDLKVIELEKILRNNYMLGVVGIGGIGKTTLVKALIDRVKNTSTTMDSSCFACTISWDLKNDHVKEMNRILKELGIRQEAKDLDEGKKLLLGALHEKKVLLIFDDVTQHHCLDQLVVAQMFDMEGSKLIATSRDWSTLKGLISEASKLEINKLSKHQSSELFFKHAFKNEHLHDVPAHMQQVCMEIIEACDGHPLSLEIMGSCLNGQRRVRIWERALQRLKRATFDGLDDVWNRLRVNFDLLNDEEKKVVLDISCFFGKDVWPEDVREYTILQFSNNIVENPMTTLTSLKGKLLIKVDDDGIFSMHDLIREMGRRIAREDSKRIREGDYKEVDIQNARGLCFTSTGTKFNYSGGMAGSLPQLSLLSFTLCKDLNIITILVEKIKQLQWLRIQFAKEGIEDTNRDKCYHELLSLLEHDKLQNLVGLELSDISYLKIFPTKLFKSMCLKTLSLKRCKKLQELESFTKHMMALEVLDLEGCEDLEDVSGVSYNMTTMQVIILKNCRKLKNIPDQICKMTSLTTMDLTGCEQLEELSHAFGNLTTLRKLYLTDCKNLKTVHATLEKMECLKVLNLAGCENLLEMPKGLGKLAFLEELWLNNCRNMHISMAHLEDLMSLTMLILSGCEQLEELCDGFGNLTSLQELYLNDCKNLRTVHATLERMECLKVLNLAKCENLLELPKGLGKLASLEELWLNDYRSMHITSADLEYLTSLTVLNLLGCEQLEELCNGFENLTSLQQLYLNDCKNLKTVYVTLEKMECLKVLSLSMCENLLELPKGLGKLAALEQLWLKDCRSMHLTSAHLEDLTSLMVLDLSGCEQLEELCDGFGNLTSLQQLYLNECKNLKFMHATLEMMKYLKILSLGRCENLLELPKGLGKLAYLEQLGLKNCRSMHITSADLEDLTSLMVLDLSGCEQLEELCDGFGNLTSLQQLYLNECKNLRFIHATLEKMECLKILSFDRCENLMELPKGLGKLASLEQLWLIDCRSMHITSVYLEDLTSLTMLNLSGCEQLEELCDGFGNLISLQELYLNDCKNLRFVHATLEKMECLKILSLGGCKNLLELPKGLGKLASLERLWLKDCRSMYITSVDLEDLTSLMVLNLSGCEQLEELCDGFGSLTSLQQLYLNDCKNLKIVHATLDKMECLKILSFDGCENLSKVPKGLGKLATLEELWLKDCRSMHITSAHLEDLTSLTVLNLWGCEQLEELCIGFGNLTSLQQLYLNDCKNLRFVHATLEKMECLKILSLGGCENLLELPKGLGKLASLEELWLKDCRSLYITLADLEGLTSLRLLELWELEELCDGFEI